MFQIHRMYIVCPWTVFFLQYTVKGQAVEVLSACILVFMIKALRSLLFLQTCLYGWHVGVLPMWIRAFIIKAYHLVVCIYGKILIKSVNKLDGNFVGKTLLAMLSPATIMENISYSVYYIRISVITFMRISLSHSYIYILIFSSKALSSNSPTLLFFVFLLLFLNMLS